MNQKEENNSNLRQPNTQNAEHSGIENASITYDDDRDGSCSCNKWQCILGISSVAIGLGGFILAMFL